MLKKDKDRQTAWHVAVRRGKVEVLDRLWEWAKEVINRDELNKNCFQAKVIKNALYHSTLSYNKQILERIWMWDNCN
jgi:ankyrin repeat protein